MEINFNINESKEIDLNPNAKHTHKRKKNDDYDFEDPFIEVNEHENEIIELECHIENFFVYAGILQEEGNKVIKKYNNMKKENKAKKIKTNSFDKDENKTKPENDLNINNKKITLEAETNTNFENLSDEKLEIKIFKNEIINQKNKIDILDKLVCENFYKNDYLNSEISNDINTLNSEFIETISKKEIEITDTNNITIKEEIKVDKKTNVKQSKMSKITLFDEFYIKNELIDKKKLDYCFITQFEYFINSLAINKIKNLEDFIVENKFKETKLNEIEYLNEQSNIIKLKIDICGFKIQEMIANKITTDELYKQISDYCDLSYRSIYLGLFLNKKKKLTEATIKKHVKLNIDDFFKNADEIYKTWSVKYHYFKKKHFFEPYNHILSHKTNDT
ncbi:hypothetical protein GVAV_002283 [Gurleya vavrai]